MFAYVIGVVSGAALPVQTSVNTRLGKHLASPYLATLVSFTGGALAAALLLILTGEGFGIDFASYAAEPFWMWLGGFFGFILVTCNILAMPVIGSVQTVIFSVLAQILSGIVIDHFGAFRGEVIPATAFRVLGAALVVAGVMAVSMERGALRTPARADSAAAGKNKILYQLLALLSGVAIGFQVAVNAYLGLAIGSTFRATMVSFTGGVVTTGLVCLILLLTGRLRSAGKNGVMRDGAAGKGSWWMWTGGLMGVICVVANVILVNALGTGMAVVVSLIGQIAGGIGIDCTGFLGAEVRPVTLRKFAGLLIMIVGAAMIRLL
ncbi:MAG: DMT family transporter [Mogibacterium sp.]|nr:DMT family transporter [Mogibacterium sp.]